MDSIGTKITSVACQQRFFISALLQLDARGSAISLSASGRVQTPRVLAGDAKITGCRSVHLLTEGGVPDYADSANRIFLKFKFGQWHRSCDEAIRITVMQFLTRDVRSITSLVVATRVVGIAEGPCGLEI